MTPYVKPLLTQMKAVAGPRIYKWSLPAWAGRLPDGRTYNTCPSAGACKDLCYARQGTYRFRPVIAAHQRNLAMVLDDIEGWEQRMTAELQHPRYDRAHCRIHDAGDFFSDPYTRAWVRIIRASPMVTFYAYTKEIERFERLVMPDKPQNFQVIYSYGGRQDHLIDPERHRHADVFPDEEAVRAAGYSSIAESDLLAVYGAPRVGVTANNIKPLKRRQGRETFRSLQRRADQLSQERRQRPATRNRPAGGHTSTS